MGLAAGDAESKAGRRHDRAAAAAPAQSAITRLAAADLELLLETDARGTGNWAFNPPADSAAAPAAGKYADFDLDVTDFAIDRGSLAWRNGATRETQRLAVQRLWMSARDVALDATFREQPFAVNGSIGRTKDLIAGNAAWPLDVTATTDGAKVTAKGRLDLRLAIPALYLALDAEVKQTAGVAKLLGAPLDLPMPATLSAQFATSKGEVVFDPLKLVLSKRTISGTASLKTDGPRPFLSAKLASPEIDLAPPPGAKRERKGGRVFSDAPLPLDGLRRFDGEVGIAIDRLVLPNGLPLESLKAQVLLKGGRVEVQPLSATVGGGPVSGRVALAASKPKVPTLAVKLDGKDISAERIAAATGHAGTVTGGATELAVTRMIGE